MRLIAEWGQTHLGSLELARAQAEVTARVGWHYAKWQLFDPARLAGPTAVRYWDPALGGSASQRETFEDNGNLQPAEWMDLFLYCRRLGVHPLVTPFDLEAVDQLERWGVSAYKIASADITYERLLKKVAATRKPVFLSTGASTLYEVERALEHFDDTQVTLLACTLSYPTAPEDANLGRIRGLRELMGSKATVGYSDHTRILETAYGAALMGAEVLERHVTVGNSICPDDQMALDWRSMENYARMAELGQKMRGQTMLRPVEAEIPAREQARRSAHYARDLPSGHVLRVEDLIYKRPALGGYTADYLIVGHELGQNVKEGEQALPLHFIIG